MWDLSFQIRDYNGAPCSGRQSLNLWTTGKVSLSFMFKCTFLVILSKRTDKPRPLPYSPAGL